MFKDRLIHWAILARPSYAGVDVLNNPTAGNELVVYSGPARLIEDREAVTAENNEVTFLTTFRLLLPAGSNVEERDQVMSVQFETGQLLTGFFKVTQVVRKRFLEREHHVMAMLDKVT